MGVVLAFATLSTVTNAHAEARLTGDQIKALLLGNSAVATDPQTGSVFRQEWATAQHTSYRWVPGGKVQSGTWKVQGDEYCDTWSTGTYCYTFLNRGGGEYEMRGPAVYTFRIEKGLTF